MDAVGNLLKIGGELKERVFKFHTVHNHSKSVNRFEAGRAVRLKINLLLVWIEIQD